MTEREILLTAREAAAYLRISMYTLNKIEALGDLQPYRTPGHHRRYSVRVLNEYLEKSRGLGRKSETVKVTENVAG